MDELNIHDERDAYICMLQCITDSGSEDVRTAVGLLMESGACRDCADAGWMLGEKFKYLSGEYGESPKDIVAMAIMAIEDEAVDSLQEFCGEYPQFEDYYNYLDYHINFSEGTVEALNRAIAERRKEDSEYSPLEDTENLSETARFLLEQAENSELELKPVEEAPCM